MEKIERYLNNFLLKEINNDDLNDLKTNLLGLKYFQSFFEKEHFDKIFDSINTDKILSKTFLAFSDLLFVLVSKDKLNKDCLNKKMINLLTIYFEQDFQESGDIKSLNQKYNHYLIIDSEKKLYDLFIKKFPNEIKRIEDLYFINLKKYSILNDVKIPFENIDIKHNELVVEMYINGKVKEEVWIDLLNKGKLENLWFSGNSLDLLIASGRMEEKVEYYTCIFLKDLNEKNLIEKEDVESILLKIEKIWKRRDYNYNIATWLYINAFIKNCDNEKSQNMFISCLEKAPEMMKKYVFSYKETKEILFTLDNISWDNYLKIIKYCFELNIFLNDDWNKQNIIKYSVLPMLFKFSKTEKEYLVNLNKLKALYPEMLFLNNKELMTEIILNNSLNSFNKGSFLKWNEKYKSGQIDLFIKNLKESRKVNVCENLFNKLFKNYEENPKCKNREIFINIIESIIRNKGQIKNIKIKNNNESLFFEFFREAEKRVLSGNRIIIDKEIEYNSSQIARKRL